MKLRRFLDAKGANFTCAVSTSCGEKGKFLGKAFGPCTVHDIFNEDEVVAGLWEGDGSNS